MTMRLQIIPIPAFEDNYIWTLIEPDKRIAACVDPGDAAPLLAYLKEEQLELCAILITHHHWDHSGGIPDLLSKFDVPVYGPQGVDGVSQTMQGGDKINIAALGLDLNVLDIPGHTLDHLAYYNDSMLFCGDTLFSSGCGRLFEGTPQQMHNSLSLLAALPAATLMYCGHEYTAANLKFAHTVEPNNAAVLERITEVATLREKGIASLPVKLSTELKTNPFLRCNNTDVIRAVEEHCANNLTSTVQVFTELRRWKDNF